MAEVVVELISGPRVRTSSKTAEVDYRVMGIEETDGEAAQLAAETAVLGVAEDDFRGWPRVDVSSDPDGEDFVVKVTYAAGGGRIRLETSETAFSFQTTGGTQHIRRGLDVGVPYQPTSGPFNGMTPPNFGALINVSDDSVDGVDIPVATYDFTITKVVPGSEVAAIKTAIFACTGKKNDDDWNGFEAGEVLFLGAEGSSRANGDYEIVFKFSALENAEDLVVDGTIPVDEKLGWDYLWVRYELTKDPVTGELVKRARAAYVVPVFLDGDFDTLDLV